MAIYLSTEAVYRFEIGRGEPDEQGRRMLAPQEVALALAYALTDSPPADNAILRTARYFDKTNNVYLPQPHLDEEQLARLRKTADIVVIPVDAAGGISGTGEAEIDGPVTDARDFVHRLAKSQRVLSALSRLRSSRPQDDRQLVQFHPHGQRRDAARSFRAGRLATERPRPQRPPF